MDCRVAKQARWVILRLGLTVELTRGVGGSHRDQRAFRRERVARSLAAAGLHSPSGGTDSEADFRSRSLVRLTSASALSRARTSSLRAGTLPTHE